MPPFCMLMLYIKYFITICFFIVFRRKLISIFSACINVHSNLKISIPIHNKLQLIQGLLILQFIVFYQTCSTEKNYLFQLQPYICNFIQSIVYLGFLESGGCFKNLFSIAIYCLFLAQVDGRQGRGVNLTKPNNNYSLLDMVPTNLYIWSV